MHRSQSSRWILEKEDNVGFLDPDRNAYHATLVLTWHVRTKNRELLRFPPRYPHSQPGGEEEESIDYFPFRFRRAVGRQPMPKATHERSIESIFSHQREGCVFRSTMRERFFMRYGGFSRIGFFAMGWLRYLGRGPNFRHFDRGEPGDSESSS